MAFLITPNAMIVLFLKEPSKDPPPKFAKLAYKELQRIFSLAIYLPYIKHDIKQHKVHEPRKYKYCIDNRLLYVLPNKLGTIDEPCLVIVLDGADDAQRDCDEDSVPNVHGHRPARATVEKILEPINYGL